MFCAGTDGNHSWPDKEIQGESAMRGIPVVSIDSGNPVTCGRRLLAAIRCGNVPKIRTEAARAKRVSQRSTWDSSIAFEQAELLSVIVESIRVSPQGDVELFLLGHLAGRKESQKSKVKWQKSKVF